VREAESLREEVETLRIGREEMEKRLEEMEGKAKDLEEEEGRVKELEASLERVREKEGGLEREVGRLKTVSCCHLPNCCPFRCRVQADTFRRFASL
jgi:predicted RNase H-like nuclease (RuvC/YqgF family)